MTSQDKDLTSQHKDLTRRHKDLTSQHKDLTTRHKDLTSQRNCLTSGDRNTTILLKVLITTLENVEYVQYVRHQIIKNPCVGKRFIRKCITAIKTLNCF